MIQYLAKTPTAATFLTAPSSLSDHPIITSPTRSSPQPRSFRTPPRPSPLTPNNPLTHPVRRTRPSIRRSHSHP